MLDKKKDRKRKKRENITCISTKAKLRKCIFFEVNEVVKIKFLLKLRSEYNVDHKEKTHKLQF